MEKTKGRPARPERSRRNINVSDEVWELAQDLGKGNASNGFALAVERCSRLKIIGYTAGGGFFATRLEVAAAGHQTCKVIYAEE